MDLQQRLLAVHGGANADVGDALTGAVEARVHGDREDALQGGAVPLQADVGRRHTQLATELASVHHPAHNEVGMAKQLFRQAQVALRQRLAHPAAGDPVVSQGKCAEEADFVAEAVAGLLEHGVVTGSALAETEIVAHHDIGGT